MSDTSRVLGRNIIVTVIMFLACLAVAIASIFTTPWYVTLIVCASFSLSFLWVFRMFVWKIWKDDQLLKTGMPGTARVLDVIPTETVINDKYQVVKLELEVHPETGQPYVVKKRITPHLGMVPQYQPGIVLPVRISRKNRKKIVIAGGEETTVNVPTTFVQAPQRGIQTGGPTGPQGVVFSGQPGAGVTGQSYAPPQQPFANQQFIQGQQAVELLRNLGIGISPESNVQVTVNQDESVADLQRARASGGLAPDSQIAYAVSSGTADHDRVQEIIDQADYDVLESGDTAEATIVEVTDLGIKVAGNNPAIRMRVEVHPQDGSPFEATVAGFVNEQSVHKIAVGNKLIVKYDPRDLTRVAIYHTA